MHNFIKMYAKRGKVQFINSGSLAVYRNIPMMFREWFVYPAWLLRNSRIPRNKFLIFAQGRTGSTLLVDLINSHPDVFSYGEIFNGEVIRQVRYPRIYAEALSSLSKAPVCGFKVKIGQIQHDQHKDPRQILLDFHRHGWRIIYLKRDNYLQHVVSDLLAEASTVFHDMDGSHANKRRKIHVDSNQLVQFMQLRETCQEQERQALRSIPHLQVTYETDLLGEEQQRRTCSRVFAFLQVDDHEASTVLHKVTAANLADKIENYEEVVDKLRNTRYAPLL